jgi:hypothetical protein
MRELHVYTRGRIRLSAARPQAAHEAGHAPEPPPCASTAAGGGCFPKLRMLSVRGQQLEGVFAGNRCSCSSQGP